MKIIINFLRKIGFLRSNSGDYITGEYGNQKKIKEGEKVKNNNFGTKKIIDENKNTFLGLGMLIFWILIFLVISFLLVVLIRYGFNFWWLIFFIFWILFFRNFKKVVISSGSIGIKGWVIFMLLVTFSWIFLISINKNKINKKITDKEVSSSKADLLIVNQANFSSFIFGSNSKGLRNPDTVNLIITPMLNLSLNSSVASEKINLKSLAIKNLKFSKKPTLGKIKIIMPKHYKSSSCSGFFFEDCHKKINPRNVKSDKNNFSYKIVNNHSVQQAYYDQIGAEFINPQFKILFYNIGSVDYDKIMSKTGSFNSARLAEYAHIKPNDMKSVLEFDIVASFDNKKETKKHFVVNFNGQDLLTGKTVEAK